MSPLPCLVRAECVVAEVGGLQRAADDFVQVDTTNQRAVAGHGQITAMGVACVALQVLRVFLGRIGRRNPAIQAGLATLDSGQECRLVFFAGLKYFYIH